MADRVLPTNPVGEIWTGSGWMPIKQKIPMADRVLPNRDGLVLSNVNRWLIAEAYAANLLFERAAIQLDDDPFTLAMIRSAKAVTKWDAVAKGAYHLGAREALEELKAEGNV